MSRKTESEALFEEFCELHNLAWAPHGTGTVRTPDYRLTIGDSTVIVEIKEIDEPQGLNLAGVSSRVVGEHVRRKIAEARKQLQAASRAGNATVLLIYNKSDPFQAYGTEPHDFISAMYGEWTVRVVQGRIANAYHGRNATFREEMNTSFSAVGHLRRGAHGPAVTVFENTFARLSLPYEHLPVCIEAVRIEIENAA